MSEKRILAGSVTALSILAGAGFSSTSTLEEIKAKGVMTVATENEYRPFEFIENGKPMGLDRELLGLLRKYAGFKDDAYLLLCGEVPPGGPSES